MQHQMNEIKKDIIVIVDEPNRLTVFTNMYNCIIEMIYDLQDFMKRYGNVCAIASGRRIVENTSIHFIRIVNYWVVRVSYYRNKDNKKLYVRCSRRLQMINEFMRTWLTNDGVISINHTPAIHGPFQLIKIERVIMIYK